MTSIAARGAPLADARPAHAGAPFRGRHMGMRHSRPLRRRRRRASSARSAARFASDLKKVLPRIPYAKDFWAFSKAGRLLSEIHVGYEASAPYPVQETAKLLDIDPAKDCRVVKMIFGKGKGKKADKTTIIVNSNITLGGIPLLSIAWLN